MANEKSVYVGVDLGGTNIQSGLVDIDGKVLSRDKRKTKPEQGAAEVVARMIEAINDVVRQASVPRESVVAVGVGAPGAIDDHAGVVLHAPNLRWSNFPLAEKLRAALSYPVIVDNDVNVGAWGEYLAGAGKKLKVRDMLGVFVGTGVGGGLVLDGRIYRGAMRTAGEIGHTLLFADGPLGRRTVENFTSRTAIANLLHELVDANHASALTEMTSGDLNQIRSKVLKQALAANDPLTVKIVSRMARYLGAAIANTVTMLSLPAVVLGGGVTEALGKVYVDWVREGFQDAVFPPSLREIPVVAGQLGDDAGIVGAALLARDLTSGTA